MTSQVPLRIGDADRDRAVAALGDHYAAGRLTVDEFDERTSSAWQARTADDLAPLFADLPNTRTAVEPAPRAASATAWHHPMARAGRRHPLMLLPVVLLTVVVVAIVALPGPPWPLFLVFWWWVIGSMFRFARWRGSAQRHAGPHGWA